MLKVKVNIYIAYIITGNTIFYKLNQEVNKII